MTAPSASPPDVDVSLDYVFKGCPQAFSQITMEMKAFRELEVASKRQLQVLSMQDWFLATLSQLLTGLALHAEGFDPATTVGFC